MQQVLELALERAEYVIESARQRPPKRKHSSGGRKSVFQKLYDLYLEESEKEPNIKKLRRNVNLLEKLVMQETLSCLVVNLYPGNEGYSLMLRGKNGSDSETIRLPYEEGELLDYLDAEELPPILVDLLEKSQVNIFHCGCVIAEVRDYRQSGNLKSPTYQSRHILLRPTMQTLVSDVHSITSDSHKWTQEDKLLLESQLILATAEPLCLEPSVSVTCTANQLLYNKQKMNTHSMKRCFKRYSRTSLNRQQEVSNCPTPPQLKLLDYLQKRKDRKIVPPQLDLKISKAGNCVDMWKQNTCHLTVPSEVEVEKYAKLEKSKKLDDSQPSVWPAEDTREDFVFECEGGNPFQRARLSIFQSYGNPLYYGKMQTFKTDEDSGYLISPCQFLIGSKNDIQRVTSQYHELFENEAKCTVTMTHNPGGSVSGSPTSPGKPTEPENESSSVQSSLSGKGVKNRPPPVKLPSNPGANSSGSGTPKSSTPTPTNTPSTTPHPFDGQTSAPVTPCATPTPQDTGFPPQPTLLTTYSQQPMSLSQALPVMTIPLSTMVTSITTGTSSSQVMANPTGLNFINVVGSVCGPQTLMSSSNPMLGCNTGSANSAGINLTGMLPSGSLVPSALPTTIQSASQSGAPFGLKNSSSLRPVNLLQLPGASLMYNPLQQQQQQQQLTQFSPQQSPSSGQQPQEQGLEQAFINQDQAVAAQQGAVLNLAGVGSFMPPQAAVLSQPGSAVNRPGQGLPQQRLQLSSALQEQQQQALQQQQIQQLQFLQHQMAMAAAQTAQQRHHHSDSQSKSKKKRTTSNESKS